LEELKMAKHKATRNLVIGEEGKKHRHVKVGEVFEVSDEYAKEHLVPHGHVEAPAKGEPVTAPPADEKDEKGGKGKK
jgi:hypothetical protein